MRTHTHTFAHSASCWYVFPCQPQSCSGTVQSLCFAPLPSITFPASPCELIQDMCVKLKLTTTTTPATSRISVPRCWRADRGNNTQIHNPRLRHKSRPASRSVSAYFHPRLMCTSLWNKHTLVMRLSSSHCLRLSGKVRRRGRFIDPAAVDSGFCWLLDLI